MALVVLIIVAIALGFLAQMWKGRTGAGWSFLSTIVMIVAWLICDFARLSDPSLPRDEISKLSAAILGVGGGGILMLLIIASLPRRRSA